MPNHDPSDQDAREPLPLVETGKAPRDGTHERSPRRRVKLWRLPLLFGILFTGAVMGMYFQPPWLRAFFSWTGLRPGEGSANPIAVPPGTPVRASGAPSDPKDRASVVARGRLIPTGKTIAVSTPYGSGDARIARLLVEEGERVEEGALLAELDSLPNLRAALASKEAARASRAAALEQTRARVASSRAETLAALERAREASELAERELRRLQGLASRGIVSESELDAVSSQAAQAARERDRLAALAERWQGGETQPDIALARSDLAVAESDVERARAELENGSVRAPRRGTVIAIHVRPGERAGAAGVATIGDLDRMQAELEVYQTDIGRVALAQTVRIEAPGLEEALTGKVTQIGLEVERQSMISPDPAANTDARIVRVTVTLDEPSSGRARGLTGLEIVGRIVIGPR